MPEQRIVLATTSRLLRDMLRRILHKAEDLEVLGEVTDLRDLHAVIENSRPAWVILSLPYDERFPGWVESYVVQHPSVRFLAIASDGSKIKMKWLQIREQELNGLSLRDLLGILQDHSSAP
jgi:hypothetical protein